MDYIQTGFTFLIVAFIVVSLFRSIRVVPAKNAFVVERLGKYSSTLNPGFHILIPFFDRVAYKHSMKEKALDVPPQPCITQDNVKINIDGVLYMKVVDAKKASYGITKKQRTPGLKDYEYATIQLAQTTMRSVIGRLELDKTFEERNKINSAIVQVVDEASDAWGIQVTRYEIKDLNPPDSILKTMEKQMQAERERRARILESEGKMQAAINKSQGEMEKMINESLGIKERLINEAEGAASEIRAMANATAQGISKIGASVNLDGGESALTMQLTERYIAQMENFAKKGNKVILPMDMSDPSAITNQIYNSLKK